MEVRKKNRPTESPRCSQIRNRAAAGLSATGGLLLGVEGVGRLEGGPTTGCHPVLPTCNVGFCRQRAAAVFYNGVHCRPSEEPPAAPGRLDPPPPPTVAKNDSEF